MKGKKQRENGSRSKFEPYVLRVPGQRCRMLVGVSGCGCQS